MGTLSQTWVTIGELGSMNKFVTVACVAAMAGLVAAKPLTTITLGGNEDVDTNSIVERILAQLDNPIDQAIKAALGSSGQVPVVTSFQGTVSQGPVVTVETSGTLSGSSEGSNVNGQFSSVSSSQESSSSFSSSSVGEWSGWTTVSSDSQITVPRAPVTSVSSVSSVPVAVSSVSSVPTSFTSSVSSTSSDVSSSSCSDCSSVCVSSELSTDQLQLLH